MINIIPVFVFSGCAMKLTCVCCGGFQKRAKNRQKADMFYFSALRMIHDPQGRTLQLSCNWMGKDKTQLEFDPIGLPYSAVPLCQVSEYCRKYNGPSRVPLSL